MLDKLSIRNIKNITYYGYDKYIVKNIIFTIDFSCYDDEDEIMEDLKYLHKLSNSKEYFSNKCAFEIETEDGNITVSWYDSRIYIGVGLRKLR